MLRLKVYKEIHFNNCQRSPFRNDWSVDRYL